MKTLKHILSIIIWTVVGIHVVLFALLKLPDVQKYIGNEIASVLSQKLGTKVAIGNVNVGLFNRVVVDNIYVEDQDHKDMLRANRVSIKISLVDLAQGKISINAAQLIGAQLTLYQATASSNPNYQFVLDSLASKDTLKKETKLNLHIGSFIMHRASVSYDKYFEPETPNRFNLFHIHLSDIGANITLERLTNDSINLNVRKLSAKEKSGINLTKMSFHLAMGREAAQLKDLKIVMPNSYIGIGETTASYTVENDRLLKSTLKLNTSISNTSITPSDFAPLYGKLAQFDNKISLQADISVANERMNVSSLAVYTPAHDIDVLAMGWIAKRGKDTEWNIDIKKGEVRAVAIKNISQTIGNVDAPTSSVIERLGDIDLKGNFHCSPNSDKKAGFLLQTEAGDLVGEAILNGQRHFNVEMNVRKIDLGKLLATDQLGLLTASVEANGELLNGGNPQIQAKCNISSLTAKGHTYENIKAEGLYSSDNINANIDIEDPALRLAMKGSLSTKDQGREANMEARIRNFCPHALNLTSKWANKSFNFDLAATASGIGDKDANTQWKADVKLDDITLVSSDTTYRAGNIVALLDNISSTPRTEINSDFANIVIVGKYDLKTLPSSYINILSKVVPGMPGLPRHNNMSDNDFVLTANVNDAELLDQLFGVKLSLDRPVNLTTTIVDRQGKAALSLNAPAFSYSDSRYEGLSLDISQPTAQAIDCNASLTKVMGNGDKLSAKLKGTANDNKLTTSLELANEEETFYGVLNTATSFFIDDNKHQTAQVEIAPSKLKLNGQRWEILPAVVNYSKNNLEVDGFSITNGRQFLAINGKSTTSTGDSLTVAMNGVDVAYVLNLVNFHSVDFGGGAYGKVYAKALFSGHPQLYGKLTVKDFTFQNGGMGTLLADVTWNNAKGQIDINATADDGPNSKTLINGYVSPTRNYIDLDFDAQNTRLDFLMSFTHAFLSRLDGTANGKVRLVGPLSNMDLLGKVAVNGLAHVKVLGCDYTLRGDSVDFVHNDILFSNTRIYDRDGNIGYVNGGLHHKHLRRMTYDLDIKADNLLSYDFDDFNDMPFYATVYASGDVKIHGVAGLLKIDVNATPRRGTTFVYNVANPDAVANQKFIVWNDKQLQLTVSDKTKGASSDDYDLPSDTRINFIVNCNQDATLKLLMDSKSNDYITLSGDGVINADYYNNGAFKMTGTYRVDHGTYGITIQDIIKKNFVFSPGGTIIFGGNPFDAALNLEAAYTVNGVSLSDLSIGSSFKSTTIKVNCLMNIGGIAKSPSVTFDLDFPTLGTDEKQMVKSIINSEEEMNQQVVYLLGIGRFYPQGNNNSTAQGSNQPGQTSLAMQSLLSGTISSQINQLLSTVVNGNNWNFGANISTGDEGWNNAEYEGLLSGQLLNNRLLINGQFGYRDSKNTATPSFIGDFDLKYLLTPNGNLALKVYNQTNDRYFTKSSLNTQGVGLIVKRDFNGLGDLFRTGKKKKK